MRPLARSWMRSCVFMGCVFRSLGRQASEAGLGRIEAHDGEVGLHPLGRAVLEADKRVDSDLRLAGIDRRDDGAVFFADDASAYLAGARELAVVSIEFLEGGHKLGVG